MPKYSIWRRACERRGYTISAPDGNYPHPAQIATNGRGQTCGEYLPGGDSRITQRNHQEIAAVFDAPGDYTAWRDTDDRARNPRGDPKEPRVVEAR